MELDKRKRAAIQAAQAAELAAARGGIDSWRSALPGGGTDARPASEAQRLAAQAAAAAEEDEEEEEPEDLADDSSRQLVQDSTTAVQGGEMADHPDYHGRGWRPPAADRCAARLACRVVCLPDHVVTGSAQVCPGVNGAPVALGPTTCDLRHLGLGAWSR